jgi:hypothetical protein
MLIYTDLKIDKIKFYHKKDKVKISKDYKKIENMSFFDPVVIEGFSKNNLRVHVGESALLLATEKGAKSIKAFVYSKNKSFDIPGDKITDKNQIKAYFRNAGVLSAIEKAGELEENISSLKLSFSEIKNSLDGKSITLENIKSGFIDKLPVNKNDKIPAYGCLCDYIDNGVIILGD